MRYIIKQKWLTLGNKYFICDENGNDVFYVEGKWLSLGDKLSFQDMEGNELAYIAQKMLSFGPTYNVSIRGRHYATVKKKLFTFFRAQFEVDVPGPDDLLAEGSFLEHEYTIQRGSDLVATISKKWFRLTDTYGVEVAEGEDDVLVLVSAIVIDLACHNSDGVSK